MRKFIQAAGILLSSFTQASHLDDIAALDSFKWDNVVFRTKKDCSLDHHPDVSLNKFE